MHDTRKVNVMEDIYGENEHIAVHTREALTERDAFCVNVMGAPGVGKTSCLKALFACLKERRPYVVEGDIESDLDARHLRELGIPAIQLNTFGACHLDAPLVRNGVQNIQFEGPSMLFIENIGNLVCPAEFSIGEHVKLLISSVTEGSDKPYKYPLAFEKADLILVNKVDLKPYLDFDEDFFMKGLRALNPEAPVFFVSARDGSGFAEAAAWLEHKAAHMREEAYPHHHHHHHD